MAQNNKENRISDVRDALFNQLKRLTDPNCKLEQEVMRTNAIVDVTKVIVDSAKAEIEFIKVTGTIGTDFIPSNKLLADGTGSK